MVLSRKQFSRFQVLMKARVCRLLPHYHQVTYVNHQYTNVWRAIINHVSMLRTPLDMKYVSIALQAKASFIVCRQRHYTRWTYFGPTNFIQYWTTLVHLTFRVSDVTDKWNNWLDDVTFYWRHVMETAVEHNNQICGLIALLRHLFYKIYIKAPQIINKRCQQEKLYVLKHNNGRFLVNRLYGFPYLCLRPTFLILAEKCDSF